MDDEKKWIIRIFLFAIIIKALIFINEFYHEGLYDGGYLFNYIVSEILWFVLLFSFLYYLTSFPRQLKKKFKSFSGNIFLLMSGFILILFLVRILYFTSNPEWEFVWESLKLGKKEGGWTAYPPLSAVSENKSNNTSFPSISLVRNIITGIMVFLLSLKLLIFYQMFVNKK